MWLIVSQAVIRVSKKYLPGMSIGFQHPNVKVHVGDGFKFLEERKNEFDVIITDSSDPEGPAESLFQKPYFELLRDALRDGGVITTQGCSSPLLCPSCPYPCSPFSPFLLRLRKPLFISCVCLSWIARLTELRPKPPDSYPGIGLGSCFLCVQPRTNGSTLS